MNVIVAGMTPFHATKVSMHQHQYWELVYYFSGSGVLNLGSKILSFEEGDIILEPPHTPHSETSEKGFRDIYILISDYISPSSGVLHCKDNANRDFYTIISQLYREFHLKQNNWKRIVDQLLGVLHQYLIAWNQVPQKDPLVEEFERVLVSNISNAHFKLQDFLTQIPLSQDHFRRLFKKETGRTPIEYLMEKRIEHSKQLLRSYNKSDLKIKEIAALSGFDDPYYFSRLFKKVTGETPAKYRIG